MSFAYQKAFEISNKVLEDSVVIGADTIVYKDEILMKPKDKNEAKKMLGKLSGESHFVYTGIAVINTNKEFKYVDYEVTKVKFRKLDSEMIDRYIDSNEPMDKAGSYGIQGLGSVLIEGIEGDYNNVVGLPIAKLDKILKKHLNISLL
jgi:septum formation protein